MLPSTFLNLEFHDKAFIIAAIQIRTENEKKEEQKMKRKGGRKRK